MQQPGYQPRLAERAQPTFDCNKARSRIERMICSSNELSGLDTDLAAAYREAGGASGPLAADQRRWLVQRDRCADATCLVALYHERIVALTSGGLAATAGSMAADANPAVQAGRPEPGTGAAQATALSASNDVKTVVERWDLPSRQGMPALLLGYFADQEYAGNPSVLATTSAFWQQERARAVGASGSMLPQQAAWTRLVRALGLAAEPDAARGLDDVALRNLACNFLTAPQRSVYYGTSPLYGSGADVCSAGPIDAAAPASELPPGLIPLLHDGSDRFRTTGLPAVLRDAPSLPLRFVLSWPVSIDGRYDRTRGGYALNSSYFNEFAGRDFRVFGSAVRIRSPRFWPISLADATRFETTQGVVSRATLHVGLTVTIIGPVAATGGAVRIETGLPDGMMWRFVEGPIALYEDDALTRRLHEFAPSAMPGTVPTAENLASAPEAPGRAVPASADEALRNGVEAARRWNLPTLNGLPVVMRTPSQPALSDLQANGYPPNWLPWPLAMRALGLSLAPDAARALTDQNLLLTLRPYLPAERNAAIGPGQRCDASGMSPGCEFVVRDAAAQARAQDLPRLMASAPKLPFQLTLVMPVRPRAWDAARGGFPLSDNTPAAGPSFPMLFGTALDTPQPDFWPANESTARAFVAQQGPATHSMLGGEAAALKGFVYLAIPITVTGRHEFPHLAAAGFDALTGLPSGSAWRFVPGEPALYGDLELRQRIYAYGPPRRLPAPLIGTGAAGQPKLGAPLTLGVSDLPNQDAALLLLLRTGRPSDSVNWPVAAGIRLDVENGLRRNLDAVRDDPWGVFFDRPYNGLASPPDAGEIDAFRQWTEKRAAALPDRVELQQSIWAAPGPTSLPFFDPVAYRVLMHSAWPLPAQVGSDFRGIVAPLQQLGIPANAMLPIGVQVRAADTVVLSAAPLPKANYILDLPGGVPQPASPHFGTGAAAFLHVAAHLDGADTLPPVPGTKSPVVLLRLQPLSATLAERNTVIAAASFPAASWPTPAPPPVKTPAEATQPAAPAANQGPPPELRAASGPYGPDMLGIRLGSSITDAEAVIRAHMQVAAVLETEVPTGTSLLAPVSMLRGKVFIGSDQSDPQNSEQIAVFEVPSHEPGKVVAAWRTMYVADGAWDALSGQLTGKYGPAQPRLSMPAQMLVWSGGPGEQCGVQGAPWPRWAENPAFPGRRLEKVQAFSMPLPTGAQSSKLAACGPMLEADKGGTATFADRSPWFRFTTKLFDPGVLAWLAARYIADVSTASPDAKVKL